MIFYATTNIQEPVKLDFLHGRKTRFGRFIWCAKLKFGHQTEHFSEMAFPKVPDKIF